MKIKETLDFFLELKKGTKEKSELKLYDKFIDILSDLTHRDLTKNQISSIETELEKLNLKAESDNKKKYLTKKISEFEKFLKTNLALIPDGHYTNNGIVFGMIFGMIFGMLTEIYSQVYSMLGGMVIGIVIGGIMDSEAKKQGRVLNEKLNE